MCQADFEVYPSPLPPLFAPATQAIWTAILFVGDPVKKNRQSANKKFPAHNPSLPLRPHSQKLHLQKLETLIASSVIVRESRAGRTGRG